VVAKSDSSFARSFPRSALPLRSSKNFVRPFPLARLPVAFRDEMEEEIRKSDSSSARFRNEMEKEIRKS
jgi:hypothetical protein